MAKFCTKCNAQMEDNEMQCNNCGEAVAAAPAKKFDIANLMKDPKVKKFAPIAIVAIVAIFAIVVLAIFAKPSYERTVDNYLKGVINGNPKKVAKAMCSFRIPEEKDELKEYYADLEDEFEELDEELQDEYGKNAKLKYKIIGSYDLNEDDAEAYEVMLDMADYDYGKEIKGKVVVVLITAKGKEAEETRCAEIIVIKEKGSWKMLSGADLF